eukprot:TRINITY_DN82274_c0_g1_i1.p1 TRINITY_DN82274_c0_g1~~TRINITY_DN82274_c0_g1_i1.p1  ORF type:complete len:319 (-),score=56.87 TRINITY_DN82274_c0_g1_i1:73-1029(-)
MTIVIALAPVLVAISLTLLGCGDPAKKSSVNVPTAVIAPNVSMPMIAFGTMTMSNKGCAVKDAVQQWLQLGGRHVDMSLLYKTLPDAGAGIKASGLPRNELFLTTKIEGPIGYNKTIDQIRNDLESVGVDYFDLLLIHWPCPNFSDFPNKCGARGREERLDTWRGLEFLKSEKKVRALGISNYNQEQVQELLDAGFQPAVNQIQWHLGYHNDTFNEEMKRMGVHLEAWASLAGPTESHNIPGVGLGDERLKAVAKKYNASTAQVALQWSVKKGVTPVTASCSKDHVIGDLNAFEVNLSDADMKYLDSLEENSTMAIVV